MKHNIEITTVEALLLLQALKETNFGTDIDSVIASRLEENITNNVASDLRGVEREVEK